MKQNSGVDRRRLLSGITGLAGFAALQGVAMGAAAAEKPAAGAKPSNMGVPANGRAYERKALWTRKARRRASVPTWPTWWS